MEKFINNTKKLIFLKQKDILSSALIIASMIIVSRFFGFIRYRTLATYFTKEELDLFLASFRIPDFVFELLITGALSSAFIPIFIKYSKDKKLLHKNISSIINFIIAILLVFVVVLYFSADTLIPLITPGFSQDNIVFVTNLSKLLLITQLPFFVLGNILSGIAQANKIFIIAALAPIFYNIGIIAGTILFSSTLWIYGPVIGVMIGAFLFFIIQLPILYKTNFKFIPFTYRKGVLKEFIFLFVPRVLSVAARQIDLTIDLTLSTLLGAGSYTILFFSQHLQLFPVSIIGMAFGQASLPYLSDLYKEKKIEEIKRIFVNSILQLLYLSIPLSIFFIYARTPIVRIVFGGKKFDWAGTNLTALTLSFFAISIPAHTIFYFITRAFYATHDTKTPFLLNFLSVGLNAFISIYLVYFLKWPIWSLALSFSATIIFNIIILLIFYYRKIGGFNVRKLSINSAKIYVIALVSAIPSYIILKILDALILNTTRTVSLFFLLLTALGLYAVVYIFLSWVFEIEEVYILGKLIVKIKALKRKLIEVYTDVGT